MLRDRCASHDPGSMGGFIARAFALKHANRVEKLVLLSTDSGGMGRISPYLAPALLSSLTAAMPSWRSIHDHERSPI